MRNTFEERRKELLQGHNTTWVNIFDSTCAYYYAVTGQTGKDSGSLWSAYAFYGEFSGTWETDDGK